MQGSARKDVAFGPARMYTVAVPRPKRKSWLKPPCRAGSRRIAQRETGPTARSASRYARLFRLGPLPPRRRLLQPSLADTQSGHSAFHRPRPADHPSVLDARAPPRAATRNRGNGRDRGEESDRLARGRASRDGKEKNPNYSLIVEYSNNTSPKTARVTPESANIHIG